MSSTINIVIPMAGNGSRFKQAGYEKPKPFIDVNGLPMIEIVIKNLECPDANFILIARKEDVEKEEAASKYLIEKYGVKFIYVNSLTEGASCTILFARKYINNETPLLIANSDQFAEVNIKNFIEDMNKRELDGSIMTFTDPERNPKWSFAEIDQNSYVTRVKEKVAISDQATVGIYLFRKGHYFVDAAIDMIIRNDRTNNEFYTCPVYNYMINNGYKVGIYNIKSSKMHGLGTPEDLERFLKK